MRKIDGAWLEIEHHNEAEGQYWDPEQKKFTDEQWKIKVREMRALGMEYIVLLASSLRDRAYFESAVYPKAELGAEKPLESILSEADAQNMKVFMSVGYYGDWRLAYKNMISKRVQKRAFQAMGELYGQFSGHKSFYGWYLPDEAGVNPKMPAPFKRYVDAYAEEIRRLDSAKKILIAPYGTNRIKADDAYIRQLEETDVDFVAYQDEVGVEKSTSDQTGAYFEALRNAHDKAGRSALWADMELFRFEGAVYHSPLLPASIERIERQADAISPYVDVLLAYQFSGMLNAPGSQAYAGPKGSTELYEALLKNTTK